MGETSADLLAGHLAGRAAKRPFGFYLHVPFCATRCGYCDFNTYTSDELGPGATREAYPASLIGEIRLARRPLPNAGPVDTVFVGGGTPTLLGPRALAEILDAVRLEFGLAHDAEVTTEANPDSVDAADLAALREAGFTRISFGVQSLAPAVLATLERTHTPGRSIEAIGEARRAGFEHVSADLIYATPGETDDDLRSSVEEVLAAGIDHLSAYSLIVEPGTRLARRVSSGDLPPVDDDVAANRYAIVDELAEAAGLEWYEVSNWSRPGGECRHNLGYWRGADWWGAGPGAHGHVAGVRRWNVKHPAVYARAVAAGEVPVDGVEVLGPQERALERVMLGMRLREGLPEDEFDAGVVSRLRTEGLLETASGAPAQVVLTLHGRLLADHVIRTLTS